MASVKLNLKKEPSTVSAVTISDGLKYYMSTPAKNKI